MRMVAIITMSVADRREGVETVKALCEHERVANGMLYDPNEPSNGGMRVDGSFVASMPGQLAKKSMRR
jgi:hypothetical protein